MGKSVSDYMKIAWNVFGKKVVNRMVSEKAASFVGDICSKYQVEVKYKEDLMFRIRNIVAYLVNCRLEGAPINNKYVSDQIKGPIAHSLANAAASSNDYDNMMADFINWLDDEKLDDIEKCLKNSKTIIADPLFRPICPLDSNFISLPHEAFSGRIYRDEIPNIINKSL